MSALEGAPATRLETVRVELGERGYDILIGPGLLARAGEAIRERLGAVRVGIVTDGTVADLHLDPLQASLKRAGIDHATITVAPGEQSKSLPVLGTVVEALLAARLERGDAVVALGGGVVGDLAGFAAAVARRGMHLVQVPTSLLAQVDSSVGGKTGVNTASGKNLIGAFHQPALVLADTGTLDTLPERERRAGYAEIVKYGLIDRPDFHDWLEAHWREVIDGGPGRIHAIAESCRAKAAVVAADEREAGSRALLNLGHTFGHALERLVGYDPARLVHGEGVALGMAIAHRFSAALGLCPGQDAVRVERHLQAVGLPTRLADVPDLPAMASVEAVMDAIAQDKKVERGALTFILTRGIGRAFVAKGVEAGAVREHLRREMEDQDMVTIPEVAPSDPSGASGEFGARHSPIVRGDRDGEAIGGPVTGHETSEG